PPPIFLNGSRATADAGKVQATTATSTALYPKFRKTAPSSGTIMAPAARSAWKLPWNPSTWHKKASPSKRSATILTRNTMKDSQSQPRRRCRLEGKSPQPKTSSGCPKSHEHDKNSKRHGLWSLTAGRRRALREAGLDSPAFPAGVSRRPCRLPYRELNPTFQTAQPLLFCIAVLSTPPPDPSFRCLHVQEYGSGTYRSLSPG